MTFSKGENFSYMDLGLKGGYFLVRNRSFQLAPYFSVSGSFLESMRYSDPIDNDLEYQVFNSFAYGVGMHAEVKLYEYEYQSIYSESMPGYFSLKFEGGYNRILRFNDNYFKGDCPYILVALLFGFRKY